MLLKVRAQAAQEQQQQAGADDAAATAATIHATAVLVFPVEQLPADVICATAVPAVKSCCARKVKPSAASSAADCLPFGSNVKFQSVTLPTY